MYQENPSEKNQKLVQAYSLDLYYTTHFPLTEKYIALYPKSEIENKKVLEKQDRIRKELREEMLHGKRMRTGSNSVELGSGKLINQELCSNDDEESEESEDDEFLYMGPINK